MMVHRSALVTQPATLLFDLIEAAEDYPLFLPWCAGATIVCRDDDVVSADIKVRYAGLNFEFRTRNPKRRPEYMAIHLERGPFRYFEGEWKLRVLEPSACKVEFTVDYEFETPLLTRVAGPVFERIAGSVVDAFVRRALSMPSASPGESDGLAKSAP
jgi:ribosome-associated toxin RatA of RatAB toxin-antitoxin module